MTFSIAMVGALLQVTQAAGPHAPGPDLAGTYRTSENCTELVLPTASTWGDGRPDSDWYDLNYDWIGGGTTIRVSFPDKRLATLEWGMDTDWVRRIEARSGTHELRSHCYFLCTQYKASVHVSRGKSVSIKRKGRTFLFWASALKWEIERHGASGAIVRWWVDRGHEGKLEGSCSLERIEDAAGAPSAD